MRILLIADPKIPVPPKHYGGVERIVDLLAGTLQKMGHRVDLLAAPGSKAYGGLLGCHRLPGASVLSRAWHKIRFQFQSLFMAAKADVVVNFGRQDYLEVLLRMSKPLILGFQNPVTQAEVSWIFSRRKRKIALVGISEDQVKGLQPADAFTVIHNATDISKFANRLVPDSPTYLVFLGRITANKGADTAVSVARKAGVSLKLAGNVSDEPGGREFFEQIVEPELGKGVEYVGPVGDEEKNSLLGGAQALLFPIRWSEPFGIVMAESLACGTPVIATRCASTPEVVNDGVTGFLADSEDELVEAVKKVGLLSRQACRDSAEQQFSAEVMTQRYLQLMDSLMKA